MPTDIHENNNQKNTEFNNRKFKKQQNNKENCLKTSTLEEKVSLMKIIIDQDEKRDNR